MVHLSELSQGLIDRSWGRHRESTENAEVSGTLCDIIMMDICYYTSVQTQGGYKNKNEL